ncbi:hypothetical protein [Roseibium sp.]
MPAVTAEERIRTCDLIALAVPLCKYSALRPGFLADRPGRPTQLD